MTTKIITFLFLFAALTFANKWIVDFNQHNPGPYTSRMAHQDFNRDTKKPDLPNSEIVFDSLLKKNVLRLKYPKGCLGTSKERGCAAQVHYRLSEAHDTLWLGYFLFFENGFDFKKGGKLPGLCGGKCYTGGKDPSDGNGWSARIMWRKNGYAEQYVYHSNQKGQYGDSFLWSDSGNPVKLTPGQWHWIVTKVTMNQIVNGIVYSDGEIETWLDGKKVLHQENLTFRKNENVHINDMYLSTFHGGGTDSWSPNHDSYARFSDFIIQTEPVGITSTP